MTVELQSPTGSAETSSVALETAQSDPRDIEHKPEEKQEKPLNRQEAIQKAKAEIEAKNAPKTEEKAPEKPAEKADVKAETKPTETKTPPEKSESVEKPAQEPEKRQPEGRGHEAPARFLPKAKELWINTPNAVKDEVHRAITEYEEAAKKSEAATKEWKDLEQYDQMAKANGTSIKQALDNYTRVDRLLRSNPVQGIQEVLKIAGVTPEQYARHVLGQSQQTGQQPQQQRVPDPAVQHLETELKRLTSTISTMQQTNAEQGVVSQLIDPFRTEVGSDGRLAHPRYAELETQMATILQSGLVPNSLTPRQKLETAYDMAERLNPRSVSAVIEPSQVAETRRETSAGGRSIKGAPSPGTQPGSRTGEPMDRKAAIRAALAELGH